MGNPPVPRSRSRWCVAAVSRRSDERLRVLGAARIVDFFDALHHARDAWAIMPAALVLSAIATLFALVATWAGLSALRVGGAR